MSTIIELERIKGQEGFEIRVVLREHILTDDTTDEPSRTYDIETHFYDNTLVAPLLSLVDTSAINLIEAKKKHWATVQALKVLKESEIG